MNERVHIEDARMGRAAEVGDSTLADLVFIVLLQWKIVAACTFIAVIAGGIYSFTRTPVYRVEVVVAPATENNSSALGGLERFASQFGGLASLAGVDLNTTGSSREIAIATLGSRRLLEQFLLDNDLMQRFYLDRYDPQTDTFRPGLTGRVPSMDDALRYFNERILSVAEDRRTGLIRVQINWSNPQEAAAWANDLVRRVNDVTRSEAIVEANRAIEYLTAESQRTQVVGIQQSIYKLVEVQMSKVAMARSRDDYAFRVIDPAVAPAESSFVWPRRRFLVMIFMAGGFVCGAIYALWRGLRKATVQ